MSPRRYDLGRRRGAADATRSQIVEAARQLIGGPGDLTGFSMESVAARAGVSRMTVYYQFRSRAGLLEAVADDLARRGGMGGLAAAFGEDDPAKAIRAFVGTFVRLWASDPVTIRRLRAMGVVFPSEDQGPRQRDAWRRAGVENLLGHLAIDAPIPRPDLVDVLSGLTSFETFDALAGSGRSPDQVADLVTDAALQLVGFGVRRRAPSTRRSPGEPPAKRPRAPRRKD